MKRFAVLFAVLALVLPATAQQQPSLQERIDVNVVLLDAIVTDSRGNQILGLTKDDFVVKENGVEQTLESLDYFTNRRMLDQREENAPFKVEQVREERYFIFFFDKPDPGVLIDRLNLARNAARDFVRNEMKEGDLVAVAGHDVRLKIYSDFTSDKKQLERALNEATRFGRGLTGKPAASASPSILANLHPKDMNARTGTVYQALDALAEAVRPIRARKNLVLFSPGIVEMDEDVRGGMVQNRSRYFDPALESLNAANVTVYPVQLQNDAVLRDLFFHQRLEELASSTGGQYFRFGTSFSPALDKIDDLNAGYYLLSYRVRREPGRGFQKVEVSVRNQPQLRVTSRTGYGYGS